MINYFTNILENCFKEAENGHAWNYFLKLYEQCELSSNGMVNASKQSEPGYFTSKTLTAEPRQQSYEL